jgi:outer membrane biosynthesis protein TonB
VADRQRIEPLTPVLSSGRTGAFRAVHRLNFDRLPEPAMTGALKRQENQPMPVRPSMLLRSPLSLMATALVLGFAWAGPLAAQQPTAVAASGAAVPSESAEIQRLLKDGQHAQALKLIDEALAKNPKDAQMRFRRGVALSMLDRKPEALAVFQKLVDDHPDMPAPYNNMAVIYGAQGDYEKARQALERAIRTNPAYATAYQNLGDVYAQLASQAYTKALQLDKADASVQPKLALLRELTAGPNTAPAPATPTVAAKPVGRAPAPAAVPTVAPSPPAPIVVAAAPAPKPVAAQPPPAPAPAASAPVSKPVAPPPPAPAPAAKPVSAPPPAAASAPAVATATAAGAADVEAAVRAWAAAWSKRDMADYLGAYTPEFSGHSGSRKSWEQDRRDRIASRKQIKVELVDLRVTVNGDQATAKFKQVYSSDALSVTSRKSLQLVRSGGRWLIKQETVGG